MKPLKNINKILVIRTDRLGDVLLNTPVFKTLRHNFPAAHIAVVAQPHLKEIVEGNPNIDKVITYDKNDLEKGWWPTLKFIKYIRTKKFDLSIVLNPSKRANIISFLAGIKYRVGYDRKWGFLLTHKIKDNKWMGLKHEVEYNLDLLRFIGLEIKDIELYMPVYKEDEDYVDLILQGLNLNNSDVLVTVHPSSSDCSKCWPLELYACLIDKLKNDFNFKVAVVGGKEEKESISQLISLTLSKPINLGGQLTLRQLGALCKRSRIFISNDSGPVHIACAVKTPTIVIFGRTLAGVGPKRWGPYGEGNIVLQKDVGCRVCNPQDCPENFKCLAAITVEDVIAAIKQIIKVNA